MSRKILKPFQACKPLGVVLGAVVVLGVGLIAIAAVGMHSFTPSDMLQKYNDGVTSWEERVEDNFEGEVFVACVSSKSCAALYPQSSTEGIAPSEEYLEYTPLFYQTPPMPQLLDHNFSFTCDKFSPIVQLELYVQPATSTNVPFKVQPDPFPIFSYQWTNFTTKSDCDDALGLFWNQAMEGNRTVPYCALLYVLDDVCISINKTSEKNEWEIAPFKIAQEAGCKPVKNVNIGCGTPLQTWSYGSYTLIDGSALDPETPLDHEAHGLGMGKLGPLSLPNNSKYTTNLTAVGLTLRYVYDPLINTESVTNGTLFLETWLHGGTYAFGGELRGFFGISLLVIGMVFGLSSLLTTFTIAVFFPKVRYRFLYRSVHPDHIQRKRGLSVFRPAPEGLSRPSSEVVPSSQVGPTYLGVSSDKETAARNERDTEDYIVPSF